MSGRPLAAMSGPAARSIGQPARGLWVAALVAAGLIAGCDSSTSVPEDGPPLLDNFVYEITELSAEPCPTTGGAPQPSTVVRWSVDYSDPDGDVEAPFLMLWQSQFYPRELAPETALLTVPEDAISAGNGSAGTISLRQCVKFAEQESIRLWIWILDRNGHWSDYAYLEIERPEGAPAPPRTDPSPVVDGDSTAGRTGAGEATSGLPAHSPGPAVAPPSSSVRP